MKVTGYFSVCVFVPKDLVNIWTDMVFLYSKDSYRSREQTFFGGG